MMKYTSHRQTPTHTVPRQIEQELRTARKGSKVVLSLGESVQTSADRRDGHRILKDVRDQSYYKGHLAVLIIYFGKKAPNTVHFKFLNFSILQSLSVFFAVNNADKSVFLKTV